MVEAYCQVCLLSGNAKHVSQDWPDCTGCLPHVSEGRGESQPAAHSPEFQSHNLRSGTQPNGQAGPGRASTHDNQAQSHRARPAAHHVNSNGHVARTEGAPGVHDVLSGEDSAPDTGRAVTSPAPGSAPGASRELSCTSRWSGPLGTLLLSLQHLLILCCQWCLELGC